ncbi:MAG: (d)CMP kinase [Bacteroidia bacterium]|nr:(d)CMP kinase [Bacteroidia bacterium]MDW8347159.1 (d)CMP kinase [Bacteroidia bacterium]
MPKDIIIAIDGYSACGKSTTARLLAEKLEYVFIDSGAMYRATTLYFLQHKINFNRMDEVIKALENIHIHFEYNKETKRPDTYLNGEYVEEEIRSLAVSECVSEVSAISAVRRSMVAQQQMMGKNKRIVMDGRDIGTHVFPDAELKIFMTADLEVRVQRRVLELQQKGHTYIDPSEVRQNLLHRDYIDSHRTDSPLTKAADAIELDTTYYTIPEQVSIVYQWAMERIQGTTNGNL